MGWVSYSDDNEDRRADNLPYGNALQTLPADTLNERQRGKYIPADAGSIRFSTYALAWWRSQRFDEPTRRAVYERLSMYIIPYLGRTALAALTPAQLRTWDRKMRRSNLRASTQQKLRIHVQAILDAAVAEGRIPGNPCDAV